jgi:gluconolactonase
MEIDEKGNLYVAETAVQVYSPTGKLVETLRLAEKPTNLAFGDPDGLTLYITTKTTLYRTRVKVGGVGFDRKSGEAAPAGE